MSSKSKSKPAEVVAPTKIETRTVGTAFKVEREVTLRFLKTEVGQSYPIKITGPIVNGVVKKDAQGKPKLQKNGEEDKSPDQINAMLLDQEDGHEISGIVINAPMMLRKRLEEGYPDNSYVGKLFMVTNLGKLAGAKYISWEILEISLTK